MLLSLSYEEQQFFERNFQRIRRNVSRNKPIKRQGNAYIMLSGPIERRNAVVGLAYRSIQKQKRDSMMAEAVLPAFQKEAIKKALAIGVNTDKIIGESYPYGFMACVFREALSQYLED